MKKDNCIITNENRRVVFAGEKALKYIDSNEQVFCYAPGKFEKGDVFIIVSDCKDNFFGISENLGLSCQKISIAERAVVIGKIDCFDENIILKKDCFNEQGIWISIIYDRKRIEIEKKENVICISVDGKKCILDLAVNKQAFVAANDSGIKYFLLSDRSIEEKLQPILRNHSFSGYCDFNFSGALTLSEILPQKIYRAITGGEDCVRWGKELLLIERQELILDQKYFCYSLENKEEIKASIIADNRKYSFLSDEEDKAGYEEIQYNSFRLWGAGEGILQIEKLLQKASATNATILLTGESGTGKTFLAKEIHNASKRRNKPFIHVNCAAIPYHLIESELFGYEEGAFSGAKKGGKKGFFDLAYGGTLFLDEISEIPLPLQGKLLEVLQSKTYYPVGGTEKHTAEIRLIVATNRNLKKMVAEKSFREDLYYRINVFPIELPPLRERMNVINTLVSEILPEICERLEVDPVLIEYNALEKIKSYSWPGNIRELENILEKAVILSDRSIIMPEDIIMQKDADCLVIPKSLSEVREESEKRAIAEAIKRFDGDKIKAAKYLGISRSAIFEKIRKYAVSKEEKE